MDRHPTLDRLIVAAQEPTPVTVVERPAAPERDWSGLLRWVSITGAVLAIFAGGAAWRDVKAHAADAVKHLDVPATVKGGGVAYQQDVRDLGESLRKELRLLRRDMRVAVIDCRRIPGDGMRCSFTVPEGD